MLVLFNIYLIFVFNNIHVNKYLRCMKSKWLLVTGLVLLTTGIILKFVFVESIVPIFLIVAGVILKIYYILGKIIQTNYKAGYEILFLLTGLTLFFLGMYLKEPLLFIEPIYFKVLGILLKVTFIFLFIRKTKNN